MKNKRSLRHEKKLPNKSTLGNFEAELCSKNNKRFMEYALVHIDCCNYKFYKKLCEAVQPILDELTVEMDEMLFPLEGEDSK